MNSKKTKTTSLLLFSLLYTQTSSFQTHLLHVKSTIQNKQYQQQQQQQRQQQQSQPQQQFNLNQIHTNTRLASISAEYDDASNASGTSTLSGDVSLGEKVRTVTVAYIDQMTTDDDDDDDDETNSITNASSAQSDSKRERIVLDIVNNRPIFTYEVTLPIVGTTPQAIGDETNILTTSVDLSNTLGVTLNELQPNTNIGAPDGELSLSRSSLIMDSLRYVSLEEQSIADSKLLVDCSFGEDGADGSIQMYDEKQLSLTSASSSSSSSSSTLSSPIPGGVIVSRVIRGGLAWKSGVRAGDRIVATSATVGDKTWPKSTLDGIRSAVSSRKVMFPTSKFQLQRSFDDTLVSEAELVQEFELSLSRPMGIHIEDTPDGYVRISGFTVDCPQVVKDKLQVGDRIIAVDSSLGNKLWPISTVEGTVSAVTTRLPGQQVRLRFERVVEKGTDLANIQSLNEKVEKKQSLANDLLATYTKYQKAERSLSPTTSGSSSSSIATENEQLLNRCRDVLKRYIYVHDPNTVKSASVPSLVADRVLEALAAASASLDAKTLSLVMNAYITSNEPREALRVFEATVGLASDGSSKVIDVVIEGKKDGQIVPDSMSLNLFTATDLIRAHSLLGDAASARRVLAAVEGDEIEVNGIKAKNWNASFKADTKCYNTVLSAVSKSKNVDIEVAEELYNIMCEPALLNTPRPKKNVATYNTMISAYARSNRRTDAFALLNEMLDAGLNPDKYTITSLVKVVVDDGDFETALNLLSDMKKAGIKTDVVGYNTVIRALCDRSQWFEAKNLVADMEARGISPDAKTYGLLMNGLLKLNKPGPCLTLFESACADQTTAALMENVQLYTTAITAAATLGDHERALELVSRMTFAGVKPNMKTLTSLMGACLSAENYKYALEVYGKINNPDGYAVMLGIRGHAKIGDFDTAISITDKNQQMSGKQIMSSYNYIIESALANRNYAAAQNAMDNLLENNYIPSKITFRKILESLGLLVNREKRANMFGNQIDDDDEGKEKFKYLLSLLDSIEKRKLPFTGQMYSCILYEGARLGGLYKKIASLISKSRSDALHLHVQVSDDVESKNNMDLRWTELLDNYSNYKSILAKAQLPAIRVRINQKEIRSVLSAEQKVTYGAIRRNKKNLAQSRG